MRNFIVIFCLVINHLQVKGQNTTIDSLIDNKVHSLIGILGDGPKEAFRNMKPIFNDDTNRINNFFNSLELVQDADSNYEGRNYFNYQLQLYNQEHINFEQLVFSIYPEDAIVIIKDNYYKFQRNTLYELIRDSKKIKQEVFWLNDIEKTRVFYDFLKRTQSTYFTSEFKIENQYYTIPIIPDSTFVKYDGSIYMQLEYSPDLSSDEENKLIEQKVQQSIINASSHYLQNYLWSWNDSNTIEQHRFFIHTNRNNLLDSLSGVIIPWSRYNIKFIVHSVNTKEIKSNYNQLIK